MLPSGHAWLKTQTQGLKYHFFSSTSLFLLFYSFGLQFWPFFRQIDQKPYLPLLFLKPVSGLGPSRGRANMPVCPAAQQSLLLAQMSPTRQQNDLSLQFWPIQFHRKGETRHWNCNQNLEKEDFLIQEFGNRNLRTNHRFLTIGDENNLLQCDFSGYFLSTEKKNISCDFSFKVKFKRSECPKRCFPGVKKRATVPQNIS